MVFESEKQLGQGEINFDINFAPFSKGGFVMKPRKIPPGQGSLSKTVAALILVAVTGICLISESFAQKTAQRTSQQSPNVPIFSGRTGGQGMAGRAKPLPASKPLSESLKQQVFKLMTKKPEPKPSFMWRATIAKYEKSPVSAYAMSFVELEIKAAAPGQFYFIDCAVSRFNQLPLVFTVEGTGYATTWPCNTTLQQQQHLTFMLHAMQSSAYKFRIHADERWTFHSCEVTPLE